MSDQTDRTQSIHPLDLEQRVTELWGPLQWNWVIGRTLRKNGVVDDPADHIWFFYCGDGDLDTGRTWEHRGYGESIADVLTQMIELKVAAHNGSPAQEER